MGVYANWVESVIEREVGAAQPSWGFRVLTGLARAWNRVRHRPLDLKRTLLIADFEPTEEFLVEALGGLPARLLLPFPPRRPIAGIAYGQFETGTNPLAW